MKLKKILSILNRIILKTKVNDNSFEKLKSINTNKDNKFNFNYSIAIDSKHYNQKQKVENRLIAILSNSGILKNFILEDYLNSSYDNLMNYLVDKNFINEIQAKNTIKFYINDYRVGLNLLNSNYIKEKQLEEALNIQEQNGRTLGEILIKKEYITEELLTDILVQKAKMYS